jgi:CRISPR RNA silencing complex Cmr2 subunit-like protein
MNLVLIETSGNQQYIFSTNKLRENVGASELTYRVGTQWTLEAVKSKQVGGSDLWDEDAQQLRKKLLTQKAVGENSYPVEVIVATSGKALLLVSERETGREIVRQVTAKALKYAPGMDVCGVVSEDFEWEKCPLGNVNRRVHEMFEEARAARPTPAMRFLRLPVVADCATSGLPAKKWDQPGQTDGEGPAARSAVSLAKRKFRLDYKKRMQALLDRAGTKLDFLSRVDDLIDKLEKNPWLAVVHADGNGLGQVFLEFGRHAGCEAPEQNRDYVNKLRRFSLALDVCTENAFLDAVDEWVKDDKEVWYRLPILPIVLGGDDVTIVCDGRAALNFTEGFLSSFEERSTEPVEILPADTDEEKGIISTIVKERLSACAGVSIIKPHFPFSSAYDLAEDLIRSAKQVKDFTKHPGNGKPWPCSALDFHLHYDTSGSDLDELRKRLIVDEGETKLHSRPYVVTPSNLLKGADGTRWAQLHDWNELQKRVDALTATDQEGRRQLPNSQMHDLRAGLFLGRAVADARYKLIRHRYEDDKEKAIGIFDGDNQGTLFELETSRSAEDTNGKPTTKQIHLTKLLDALDVAALLDAKRPKIKHGKSGGVE